MKYLIAILISTSVFSQAKPTFLELYEKNCFPTQKEIETLVEGLGGKFYSLYELGFDKYSMMHESHQNGNTDIFKYGFIDSYTHKCLAKLLPEITVRLHYEDSKIAIINKTKTMVEHIVMLDREGEDKRVYLKESVQDYNERYDEYLNSGDSLFPEITLDDEEII